MSADEEAAEWSRLEADAELSADDIYKSLVDRTDAGNANLLVQLAGGNLRYVHETKQWLRWTGSRWQIDTHEVFVNTHALEVAKYYLQEAHSMRRGKFHLQPDGTVIDSEDILKWAAKCRNKSTIDNMVALARKVPGVPISVNDLDKNPWLLGVENGVVDLRTGELHEAEAREDYVTKRCPIRYEPSATAPRWERLIHEATGAPIPVDRDSAGQIDPRTINRYLPRPELAGYLHRALGLAITGSIADHVFFFAIGEGSNGKSLIFDTVKAILGPYAVSVPANLFMQPKYEQDAERPTAMAAMLAGSRLVVASEVNDGQRLNTAAIKTHTGDTEMTARRMRENPFTFTQTHKVWMLTNVEPHLDHIDSAIRGRLHLAPFDRRWNRPGEVERNPTLPDGDKSLGTTLKLEAEGILAWLVQGAMLYQIYGLLQPAEVIDTTRSYIKSQDTLGRWLATMERCDPSYGTKASDLFAQFAQWCGNDSGGKPEPSTQKGFSLALGKRELSSKIKKDGTYWGLRIPPPEFSQR